MLRYPERTVESCTYSIKGMFLEALAVDFTLAVLCIAQSVYPNLEGSSLFLAGSAVNMLIADGPQPR
jgi:hypothetical protein